MVEETANLNARLVVHSIVDIRHVLWCHLRYEGGARRVGLQMKSLGLLLTGLGGSNGGITSSCTLLRHITRTGHLTRPLQAVGALGLTLPPLRAMAGIPDPVPPLRILPDMAYSR